jgi:hypothetical protein
MARHFVSFKRRCPQAKYFRQMFSQTIAILLAIRNIHPMTSADLTCAVRVLFTMSTVQVCGGNPLTQ